MSVKLLIVDDHHIVRRGIASLFRELPGYDLVGEAEDGKAAILSARNLAPHVILMDVSMPNLNGIDATRRIKAMLPKTKVIGLSCHMDWNYLSAMMMAGASGYLVKTCETEELFTAIETVMAGKTYLSPDIAGKFMDGMMQADKGGEMAGTKLTGREKQILQLLSEGKSAKEIGLSFEVSSRTIDSHRQKIMKKLGIYNIANLTKYAIRSGLTTVE